VDHNVLAYGDNGLKADFGGHDVSFHHNVLAYVGACWATWQFHGYNDAFTNNTCVFRNDGGYGSTCFDAGHGIGWAVGDNRVYSRSGDERVCGTNLTEWLARGKDAGTTVGRWPDDAQLVHWGRELLRMPPAAAGAGAGAGGGSGQGSPMR